MTDELQSIRRRLGEVYQVMRDAERYIKALDEADAALHRRATTFGPTLPLTQALAEARHEMVAIIADLGHVKD